MQSKPKKILYLITKSNWGGAQRYVFDLATHLPPHTEAVVASGGTGLLVDRLQNKGVRTIPLQAAARDVSIVKEVKLLVEVISVVQKEKPDVLHVNSSKLGGLGAFVGWLTGTHTIFTVHGWPFNEDRNIFARSVIYFFSWLTVLFSDAVITLNKQDFAQGKRMFFAKNKIRLINNAVEPIDFYSREKAREALGLSQTDCIVGAIAELHPNKGLRYLMESMRDLDATLVVIGSGEETFEKNDKVILKGFVPDAPHYLKAFDIFVLPSLKEGTPYVLLEAARAGLPIVATRVGGIPDALGPSGILVSPKNPGQLSTELTKLISNPEERRSLGEKLKAYQEDTFEEFLGLTHHLYTR